MPIYDHRCDHCGHAFSVVRSFDDPPVEHCPACGKRPRRLIALPALVFKGSGWYKTDSRPSSSSIDSASSASKDAAGGGDKGDKGDKKTPAKTSDKGSASSSGG
jgi:putative FmdB family regulatory protein